MGVLFDSAAAAGAVVLSVFLAFGNVIRDTHTLLEATSHVCTQSCAVSRGFDGERVALAAVSVVALGFAVSLCRRPSPSVVTSPQSGLPNLLETPAPRSGSARRRQGRNPALALSHLAVDANSLDQWLR